MRRFNYSEDLSDDDESCSPKCSPKRGPPGKPGCKGSKGERGRQGCKGERGERGERGPEGRRGLQGPPGPEGSKGERGERGPTGPEGRRGPQGPPGSVGPQGPKGDRGNQGSKGDRGEMGPMGRQGPEGRRGPMGCQGEQGKKGPTGPTGKKGDTGARGATGKGGGTILKCIDIRFQGWAGETIIKTPPRDSKDNIQIDIYYLDCKADLFISTGSDINAAWATIDSPNTPYFYYQYNGTENLVCPGSTGTTGATGTSFKKQIWYVVPNPDPASPIGGTITPLTTYYPELKEGDKVFDACSGNLYELVNGSWECCGNFGGNKFNCIDIKYQGFGGISLPRDITCSVPPCIYPPGIYFLDYGGTNSQSNDADLWVSTGNPPPNPWTQVDLFPNVQNPEPFFYFEVLNGPNPMASQASIIGTTGSTGTSNVLNLAGEITGKFAVGQLVIKNVGGALGTIIELGTGTGKEGTYILDTENPIEGPFIAIGTGQIPSFTSQNTGRLWYVEPVQGAFSTLNGKATQYQLLCNLQPGDKVIDTNTGNIYTLFCDSDHNCYWTCSPILPCEVVNGICPTECGVTGTLNTSPGAPCCNIRGPTGPTGPGGECLKTGCIEYNGRCGESKPITPYTLGTYFLDLSDADLYQSQLVNGSLTWIPVNVLTPYLYFCSDTNQIYNVIPQQSLPSHENGCVFSISTGLEVGTKFIDCCSGIIYRLTEEGWSCLPDFPFGLTGATGCTGTMVLATTDCCALGCGNTGGCGETLDCIEISFVGICQLTINPACVGPTGAYALDLSTGKLYQSNGASWILFGIQPLDYYFRCDEIQGATGCTGSTAPPYQIYHVQTQNTQPVLAQDYLDLSEGSKLLDCATSTLYEFVDNSWEICCEILGAIGPTGAQGPTGAAGGVITDGLFGLTGIQPLTPNATNTVGFGQTITTTGFTLNPGGSVTANVSGYYRIHLILFIEVTFNTGGPPFAAISDITINGTEHAREEHEWLTATGATMYTTTIVNLAPTDVIEGHIVPVYTTGTISLQLNTFTYLQIEKLF